MNNKNCIMKILSVVLCVVFFSILCFFTTSEIFTEDKKISEEENRALTQLPEFNIKAVISGKLMAKFEEYLSDQFTGRDKIVSMKTVISRVLGKTNINDVYLGSDNRLFEVPSESNEEKLNKAITAINSFAVNSGIKNKFFILAPNTSEIYSENLPKYLKLASQKQQINNIYSSLDESFTTIETVNILKENAGNTNLYFRTDHHWTSEAAFLVFKEFMKAGEMDFDEKDYETVSLSNSFFGTLSSSSGIYEKSDNLNAILPKNFDGRYYVNNTDTLEKSVSVLYTDKLHTKNQYEVFFGGNYGKIEIQTDNLNKKNILIIKDSYANCFIPLLISHFEKIVIIDPRYFNDELQFVLEDNSFSHLLFLYNLNTFLEDTSLSEALN